MSKDTVLSLHQVGVRFRLKGTAGGFAEPLRSVNLTVSAGETLGILGRNGTGKSTLLKILSGALRPDKGSLVNHEVSVALLALQSGFDGNLSGRDNALFGGMLLGHSQAEVKARLEEVKAYSELGQYFEEPLRTYSTGMAARLGFSISTILNPDVLLVDEVLSVGDAQFRRKAERTMMQKIAMGQTVVMVSHSRGQVEKICDRCVILEDGQIIEGTSVTQVLDLYESLLERKPPTA
ncbi:ABC transporter ATP-binding protein [Pseudomonas tohonis]|uniref:ABC transporter ATP-binding protein n=1 Tax=Pseudomonas tohonis TaxID=2725477 RepID=UPI0021D8E64C|nr:ABC transporter ATP-binding protein [Pseudomonas tohonis]UXY52699.1 ABC transporter ATP-binding protein [Pseudomonas tohonis]